MRNVLILAPVVACLVAGDANAQYQSMEPYRNRLAQARIAGEAYELLIAYRQLESRFIAAEQKLDFVAADPYTRPLFAPTAGGYFARRYTALREGMTSPGVTGPATSVIESLESIRSRTEAGERWDPDSSERFLREAREQLQRLRLHISVVERQVLVFGRQAVIRAPTTYYRIEPGGRHYRH